MSAAPACHATRRAAAGWTARAVTISAALATLLVAAHAAEAPSGRVLRQQVDEKAGFLQRLLADSPAQQRILASTDDEARRLLQTAIEQQQRATALLVDGDLAGADKLLNEAMWNVGKARQRVPDAGNRTISERVRFARLLATVGSLRDSYERHLVRTKALPRGAPVRDAELERVDALVEDAKGLDNAERTTEANRALSAAERNLLGALNGVLGATTLHYAERFETVAEEYAWELDRNTSYAALVPVALTELQPSASARQLIATYQERARMLLADAQQHAAKRNHRAALVAVREGTAQLQRALTVAGVVVPTAPTE